VILEGTVKKSKEYWLVEVPAIDLMTQGKTRGEALDMIIDAVETLVDKPGFKVGIHDRRKNVIGVWSDDAQAFMDLMLERGKKRE